MHSGSFFGTNLWTVVDKELKCKGISAVNPEDVQNSIKGDKGSLVWKGYVFICVFVADISQSPLNALRRPNNCCVCVLYCRVTPIHESRVISSESYILFYEYSAR